MLPDLTSFAPTAVFADGIAVARRGRMAIEIAAPELAGLTDTMKLAPPPERAFRIEVPGVTNGSVRLRAIEGARFGKWSEITAQVRDGIAILPEEASLLAMVHRHGRAASIVHVAPLLDWGQWQGALATTVSHDSHNLVVFGREAADMALAARAVIEAGGGMAVVARGTIKALLPLPIAGLVADAAPETIAAQFAGLKKAADGITQWKPPYRIFKAVTGASLACNPGPHLTDLGLTYGTSREIVPLIAALP
jgi:adenine deaminase